MLLFQVTDKCPLTPCPRICFRLRCCSNIVTEHFTPRELGLLSKGWYCYLNEQGKLRHGGECPPYRSTFPPKNYFLNWGCYHAVCEAFLRWGMIGNSLLVAHWYVSEKTLGAECDKSQAFVCSYVTSYILGRKALGIA